MIWKILSAYKHCSYWLVFNHYQLSQAIFYLALLYVREALEIVSIDHFVLFIFKKTLGLKAYKNLHADQLKCIDYVSIWNFSEKHFPCARAIPDYECKRIIMRHGMHQVLTPSPLPGHVFVKSFIM